MQLIERGLIQIDQPVASIIPEFAEIQVLEGFDGDTPRLRPPKTQVTLRHLATHTSGFAYELWNDRILKYLLVTGHPGVVTGSKKVLFTPLAFDPGTDWAYGIGMDWLSQVVEAVSGQAIDKYLEDNIFGPLGMTRTTFAPSQAERASLVTVHARRADGTITPIHFDWVPNPEYILAGHGLYSTADDYMKFLQMFLHDGRFNGHEILEPASVRQMTENRIGDLYMQVMKTADPRQSCDAEFFPGMKKKHSFGFQINTEQWPGMRSAGSLAWAGLYNVFYWWDPTSGVAATILMQFVPFQGPAGYGALHQLREGGVRQPLRRLGAVGRCAARQLPRCAGTESAGGRVGGGQSWTGLWPPPHVDVADGRQCGPELKPGGGVPPVP